MPTGSPSNTATARRAGAHSLILRIEQCRLLFRERAWRKFAERKATIGHTFRLPVLLALVLTGHAGFAADSGDVIRTDVRDLITQLNSGTRAVRVEAERKLVAIGPKALAHLPAPELLPTVSVRQAVRRVRVTLERQAALISVQASTVTFAGNETLANIVAELVRQTGNDIETVDIDAAGLNRQYDIEWLETPFWSVIGDLQVLGLTSEFDSSGRFVIRPVKESDARLSETIQGSFRIRAGPVSSELVAPTVGIQDTLLQCPLRIECEPRLRPLFLRMKMNDFHIKASDGSVTEAFNAEARIEVPLGDGGRVARTELVFLSKRPLKAFSLTGAATVLTAGLEQPIMFRDLSAASGTARRRGGVTVTLQKVSSPRDSANQQFVRVEARISYDAGANAFESHQTWVFHNRTYLKFGDGETIAPAGIETLFQGDGSVGVAYRFPVPDADADLSKSQFIYMAPTLLISVPVKIAIDDLVVGRD